MTYGEMTLRSEKHHKTQNDLKARWGFYFPRCGRLVHIYTHKRRHDLDRKNTHKRSYIIQYIHASSTMPSTRDAVRTKSHYQKTNVLYIYRNIPLKYIYVYQKVGIIRSCISAIYIYILIIVFITRRLHSARVFRPCRIDIDYIYINILKRFSAHDTS